MTRLKGLLLLAVMFVCANLTQAQTQMQIEFEKFLTRFPKKDWNDLKTMSFLTLADMEKYDTIPIEVANRNIWYEEPQFGPDNIYNHVKTMRLVKNKTSRIAISVPPPYIKLNNEGYKQYDFGHQLGLYSESCLIVQDYETGDFKENPDMLSRVYPIALIDLYDDYILLIVGNRYIPEFNYFDFAIDAFIFCRSTQQLTSGFMLCGGPSTLIYDNYMIVSYEYYETENGDVTDRYIYRIEPDGYIHQLKEYSDISYLYGNVSDTDGYVNVRESTSTDSNVLYTIPDGCHVTVWPVPGTNWVEVVEVKDGNSNGGYVHKSRIK